MEGTPSLLKLGLGALRDNGARWRLQAATMRNTERMRQHRQRRGSFLTLALALALPLPLPLPLTLTPTPTLTLTRRGSFDPDPADSRDLRRSISFGRSAHET